MDVNKLMTPPPPPFFGVKETAYRPDQRHFHVDAAPSQRPLEEYTFLYILNRFY